MKHEARNSKYETISNTETRNSKRIAFFRFGFQKFGFASDFGFRISDFRVHRKPARFVSLPTTDYRLPTAGAGFTLLEMMVATGIFAVVIVIAIGAMVSLNSAQVKAMNIQNIQDNLRFTLESMTKEIRTGTGFSAASCGLEGCSELTFLLEGLDTEPVGYCVLNGAVLRFLPPADCATGSRVTADTVRIDRLLFYTVGLLPGAADNAQPRITIVVDAESQNPTLRLETTFHLQTTITARLRDIL